MESLERENLSLALAACDWKVSGLEVRRAARHEAHDAHVAHEALELRRPD
jgi:hypothetical protein